MPLLSREINGRLRYKQLEILIVSENEMENYLHFFYNWLLVDRMAIRCASEGLKTNVRMRRLKKKEDFTRTMAEDHFSLL